MNFVDEAQAVTLPSELTFADGLVGLPELHAFTLSVYDDTGVLELSTTDGDGFTFAALPADAVRPGMTGDLAARDFVPAGAVLLVLLSVHGDPPVVSANLAGPIVVDTAAATAGQIVLEDPAYPLRAALGDS